LKKGVSVSRCCPPNTENIFWPELFLLLGTRQFAPETPHGKTTESPTTMAAAAICCWCSSAPSQSKAKSQQE
jgi:hypothetical protein